MQEEVNQCGTGCSKECLLPTYLLQRDQLVVLVHPFPGKPVSKRVQQCPNFLVSQPPLVLKFEAKLLMLGPDAAKGRGMFNGDACDKQEFGRDSFGRDSFILVLVP